MRVPSSAPIPTQLPTLTQPPTKLSIQIPTQDQVDQRARTQTIYECADCGKAFKNPSNRDHFWCVRDKDWPGILATGELRVIKRH